MIGVSYQALFEEHDLVLELITETLRRAEVGADGAALSSSLATLSATIHAHFEHEDQIVTALALRLRQTGRVADAERLVREIAAGRSDWTIYFATWTAQRIQQQPDRFRQRTAEAIARLHTRIDVESELLYTPALREAVIPLRRPGPHAPATDAR